MTRVGVLRGGPSDEFEVSIKTGQSVLDNLSDRFDVSDILIDRNGQWILNGLPVTPQKIARSVDVFFNALHGSYGEDGKLQQLLDSLNVPYTGAGPLGSALAINKFLAKKAFVINNIKVAEHEVLSSDSSLNEKLVEIFRTWLMPVVVKPVNGGSSLGASVVYSFLDLENAVKDAFKYGDEVMIEEYIRGKEATCGVLENFRGYSLYTLPPVEIISADNSIFFDYNAKYDGTSQEIVPGRFSQEEKDELQRLAKLAHTALGLKHYSRSDFIVSLKGIYILETNTLPGLTEESLYPKSLEAIGSNLTEFTEHLIHLALNRK